MEFEIKKESLESIVNDEIEKLSIGYYESSKFAIYMDGDIEVQVITTKAEDELMGEVYPKYVEDKQ